MNRSLPLLVVLLLLIGSIATMVIHSTYPYVQASEEARKSIMVTQEQRNELIAAAKTNDMIAFGLVGSLLCIAVAFGSAKPAQAVPGAALGLVLGGGAGIAAAWLGYWFYNHPSIDIKDSTMHHFLRCLLMFLPLAVAAGLSVVVARRQFVDVGTSILGALLGVVATSAIYAMLSGLISTVEGSDKIFPHFLTNRFLIVLGSMICIGAGSALLLNKSKKAEATPPQTPTPQS